MKKPLVVERCPVCGEDPIINCLIVPIYHIYCNNDNCKFDLMVSGEGRSDTVNYWNKTVKEYRKKVLKE